MGVKYCVNKNSGAMEVKEYVFRLFHYESSVTSNSHEQPNPRSGHRIVCSHDSLYVYGGYHPGQGTPWDESSSLYRELWQFNLATNQWKKLQVSNIPSELASNAVSLQGSVLLVFGGTGVPFGASCSNKLYVCDFNQKLPELSFVRTTGDIPEPMYGQAIVVIDKFLYTVGGTTGYEYSSDIHRLNLKTKVWEAVHLDTGKDDEPTGRYRHELGFDGQRIIMLGGGTAEEAVGFEKIPAFDIEKSRWLCLDSHQDPKSSTGYPPERRFHSCVQIPGRHEVIIIGGYTGTEILGDTWHLDLHTLQWTQINAQLPAPVYFHSSSVTPAGKMYTFGGIIPNGKDRDRTSNVFSAWICIPKLKEMCWDALLHYYNFGIWSEEQMRLLGFPLEFIQRTRFH